MKINKLKIVSLIVAVFMAVTLFSGCGNNEQQEKNTASNSSKDTTKTMSNEKEEPLEIEWLAYQTTAQPNPEAKIVKMVEDKYNVKFKFWYIDNKRWEDSLNVKLAAGEMPDVLWLQNWKSLGKYVEQGVLGELPEEKIRELAPNYAKVADKYDTPENTDKMLWKAMKYNGKNYGMTFISLNGGYAKNCIWRTDWLKNVGIEKIPETLDEYETALYKFRNNDPDKNNKKDTYGFSDKSFGAIFGAFGVAMDTKKGNIKGDNIMIKNGKPVFSVIQPEAKDALALLQKWYKDEIIDPEFVTGENQGGYVHLSHAFMNGKIGLTGRAMYYHYAPPYCGEGEEGGPCYREIKKMNPEAEFEISAPPIGSDGKSGTLKWGVTGARIGLTAKCIKNERKVKTVLKMIDDMFTDDEYAKLVMWGIKDEDYKVDDKGSIVRMSGNVNVREKGVMIFNFLNGNPDMEKKYNPVRFEFADKYANFPGYIDPIIPTTEEALQYNETLKKMAQEAYVNIITGTKNIDYFDEFVQQFRKNGGDKVEKAMEEAYNKMLVD